MNRKLINISVVILASFFIMIYPTHSQGNWVIKEISRGGYYNSIAIDSSGYPHISYLDDTSDPTNYVLKHAFFDGSKWNIEIVDEGDVGWWNAITIDSLGHIHISYHADDPTYSLRYAYFDGTKWNISSLGNGGYSTSIAVDTNNYPHISHVKSDNTLEYVRFDGNSWIAKTIATNALYFGETSMVLTSSGKAHIAFCDGIPGHLFWANNLSGTWEVNFVDDGWRESSIALDSLDNPHVAYIACPPQGSCELKYGRFDGASWQIQTATDGFGLSGPKEHPSMKLDSQDHPHISFGFFDSATDTDGVSYIYFDGGEWVYSLIDGSSAFVPSLALDEGGLPHVSYRVYAGYLDDRLKFAHPGPPLPSTNVSASDGTYIDRVEVTWAASTWATSYTVYRATSLRRRARKAVLGATSGTFFNDTTAVPKTTYYYWVKASNAYGASNFSSYDAGYRSDGTPPAPTSVSASDGTYTDRVEVAWLATFGATSYTVYRATSLRRRATKTVLGMTSDTFLNDTTATPGRIYYYWVNASNTYGTSNFSAYDSGYR